MGGRVSSSLRDEDREILDEVYRRTRSIKQIAYIDYEDFKRALKDLNELSEHFLDENGKQLIFAVKKGTDRTLLWKATVRVACLKVDSASKNVDSFKPLNLKEFLQVYNSLHHQAAAVKEEDSYPEGKRGGVLSSLFPPSPPQGVGGNPSEENPSSLILPAEEEAATSLEECCICLERKPDIILPCAHSYCLPCIERWNVDHKTCPVCREIVTSTEDSWVISDVPDSAEIVTDIQKSLMELAQ